MYVVGVHVVGAFVFFIAREQEKISVLSQLEQLVISEVSAEDPIP